MAGAMLFSGCAANAEATANGGWICTGTDAEMQVYVFGAGAALSFLYLTQKIISRVMDAISFAPHMAMASASSAPIFSM